MATTALEQTVTVLIAHGSRNPAAQIAHEQLVRAVGERGSMPVTSAYLELAEPGIADAIDQAVAAGAEQVRLLPCFLHPGNHVLVDIPAIVEAARDRHPGTTMVLLDHLGSDPGLVSLLAQRASVQ